MPSRGHAKPRRGIGVRSRRGWGPGASGKKLAGCCKNAKTKNDEVNLAVAKIALRHGEKKGEEEREKSGDLAARPVRVAHERVDRPRGGDGVERKPDDQGGSR